ncbi:MAG TPA: PadR family transcriptional regulator [Rhodothermales bacterium]|nr:PadR family transcriptional regulator [Rhodothermales bacterium]
MKGNHLGEFEELVLLTVCILHGEAYGFSVKKEITQQTGRRPTLGAVHATLYRLQDKGLLDSTLGGANSQRGGRRKRLFTITSAGLAMLEEARTIREQMWALVPRLDIERSLG